MIGCILSGHGNFAPGLMGALEMIAGSQDKFEVVPFLEEDPLDLFESKMSESVERMESENPGVIIFTDLMGGTPFRAAMLAAGGRGRSEVIVGTNLPILLECCMTRTEFQNAKELANALVEIARETVALAHMKIKADDAGGQPEENGI